MASVPVEKVLFCEFTECTSRLFYARTVGQQLEANGVDLGLSLPGMRTGKHRTDAREVLRIRLLTTVENGGVGRLKLVALGY